MVKTGFFIILIGFFANSAFAKTMTCVLPERQVHFYIQFDQAVSDAKRFEIGNSPSYKNLKTDKPGKKIIVSGDFDDMGKIKIDLTELKHSRNYRYFRGTAVIDNLFGSPVNTHGDSEPVDCSIYR